MSCPSTPTQRCPLDEGEGFAFAWNDREHSNAVINLVVDASRWADRPCGGKDLMSLLAPTPDALDPRPSDQAPDPGFTCGAVGEKRKRGAEGEEEEAGCHQDEWLLKRQRGDRPSDVRERIYVSTAIIGSKSKMLQRLFSTPLKEKREKEAFILLSEEEVPLMMVLLRLIYGQTAVLEGLELEEALHLMSLCDRYDAPGCLRQCAERVLSSGLLQSVEDADRCIDFVRSMPPHFAQAAGASDLLKKAQEVLVHKFGDLDAGIIHHTSQHDLALDPAFEKLSLNAVKELLSSEETRVKSENTVFTIVTQWVARRCHHDKQATGRQQGDEEAEEEEQRACFLELAPLIRFPQMGGGYLLDLVGKYRHMDPALEREALQFKIARPERQALLRDAATSHRRYHRRAGGRRPGEFQEFTWGVRLQDCRALPDGGVLTSAKWHVDGYLVYVQLRRRRAEGAAAAKPALQLVVLSVNDGEILPGGAGINYRLNVGTERPITLYRQEEFIHNLVEGKRSTLHGRVHLFVDDWDQVMNGDHRVWDGGVMHVHAAVEVVG